MLFLLKKLASIPHGSLERSIHFIKIEAFVLTYRKAVFGRSMRRAQAYGSQQIQGRNSIGILISQRQIPSEGMILIFSCYVILSCFTLFFIFYIFFCVSRKLEVKCNVLSVYTS